MTKLAAIILLYSILATGSVPDVKVSGAMKKIMVNGDLSTHINLDTLNKTNLYGLGPVSGLKGEIIGSSEHFYTSYLEHACSLVIYREPDRWSFG